MDNPIFENVKWLIMSGVVGFVMIILGSAFQQAFLSTFGGLFIGITFLSVVIGIILEVTK